MVLEQYIQNDYLRAIAVIFLVFVILKLFVFVTERIIVRLTKKTKSDIDDKIIEKSAKPFSIIILLIGVILAINEINLNEEVNRILIRIFSSVMVITVGYVIYVVLDLIVLRGWKKFAIKTNSTIDESLSSFVHNFLQILWVVLSIIYVLDLWGIQIGPLLAGLGIAGLAVALALQPVLSNIFSGISIILDKTVRVGDLVYLDANTKGKILRVGLRSTKINTFDNELIIVPNTKLAESMIQNVALPEPKSRVVIPFSVAYGSNIEKVKKIVLKEIKSISLACKEPEPLIRFIEMSNSSLNFKVYFYVDSFENRFTAIDEANTKIYNALNKNNINIPFPQLDVHLKKD